MSASETNRNLFRKILIVVPVEFSTVEYMSPVEYYLMCFYKSLYIRNDQLRCHAISFIFYIIGTHKSSTTLNVFLLGSFDIFKLVYNDVHRLVNNVGKGSIHFNLYPSYEDDHGRRCNSARASQANNNVHSRKRRVCPDVSK